MRLGYLVPSWPEQTHAFFWRELSALRALGNDVFPISTRRPPRSACQHSFADEAHATTSYLFPPRASAAARVLSRSPRRTAAAIAYVAKLKETSLRGRATTAALLGCAADFVAHAEAFGLDHVHGHSCADAAHLLAMARLLGGPGYSLTLHGDLPVYGVDHAAKTAHARFVSAVTRPLQKQLLDHTSLEADRVPVLTMGVDTDHFRPRGGDSPASATTGPFRLATIARLNAMKGHGYVIDAVRRLRARGLDVVYDIAGEGPHRPWIEAKVAEAGLTKEVRLLGSLGEADVLSLLHESDAFVLASEGLGEAAPVSVMEAMSAGLPVVVSRIGGTPDMIEDGADGLLFDQRDVDGLASALGRLATDEPFRRSISNGARSRALRAFDYRILAKELHERIVESLSRSA